MIKLTKLKKIIFELLEPSNKKGDISWFVDIFIIVLILLNSLALILDSVKSINKIFGEILYQFELFSIAIFRFEYILRLIVANENPKY